MRALRYDRFGDASVVELREVKEPRPGPGQLLIRVEAAALNPKDVLTRKGRFALLSGRDFPRGLGMDWAGVVEAVGPGVPAVAVGEARFGMRNGWAGATCADKVVVEASESAPLPRGLAFTEAAALPLAALTALQALRDVGRVAAGHRVFIHGASGGVGVFAIQIARALGAEVTTSSSAANQELCRSLGAHHALDYRTDALVSPERPVDTFFDVFGNQRFAGVRPGLTTRGCYVSTVIKPHVFIDLARTALSAQRSRFVSVRSNESDLKVLAAWVETGQLRPVVDGVFTPENFGEAQARIESKRSRGKVVIRFGAT